MFLANVLRCARALADTSACPPSDRCVVVVHSCICREFTGIVMRSERRSLGIVPECKLQYAHARKPEFTLYGFHFGSDHAKILGDNWQVPKFIPQSFKKLSPRTFYPLSPDCRRRSRRNFPIRFKSSKVI